MMGPTGGPETSASNNSTPRNNPEDGRIKKLDVFAVGSELNFCNNVRLLVFLVEAYCVLCEVRTEPYTNCRIHFSPQSGRALAEEVIRRLLTAEVRI